MIGPDPLPAGPKPAAARTGSGSAVPPAPRHGGQFEAILAGACADVRADVPVPTATGSEAPMQSLPGAPAAAQASAVTGAVAPPAPGPRLPSVAAEIPGGPPPTIDRPAAVAAEPAPEERGESDPPVEEPRDAEPTQAAAAAPPAAPAAASATGLEAAPPAAPRPERGAHPQPEAPADPAGPLPRAQPRAGEPVADPAGPAPAVRAAEPDRPGASAHPAPETRAETPPAAREAAPVPDAPRPAAPPAAPPAAGPTVQAAEPAGPPDIEIAPADAKGIDWRLGAPAPVGAPRAEAVTPAPPPQAVAGQVALAVGRADDGRVEVRLDPPELGRVQIQLTQTADGLQAVVMAERPETHELLRRHADVLARELGAAGFASVSLDFAAGGQAGPRGSEPQVALLAAEPEVATTAEAPAPRQPRPSAAGRLDIRL